jgi:UDPglucose 6-dehydrogenase
MNKILCIGLGKLGLIFSNILAEKKNIVYGYDINSSIEEKIKKNTKDLEPKLNYLINKNKKRFFFENNFSISVKKTNCAFIIVPTPSQKNHSFDNQYIVQSLNNICRHLKYKKRYLINITSTVNPGSCNYFINYIEKKFKLKHGKEFVLTYNPHLIALGSIYENVMNSDLVIVGSDLPIGFEIIKNIYKKIYKKKINKLKFLNLKEAEISKIAINSFVTLKISYSNTISQISDKVENINVSKILNVVGQDKRIGNNYLSVGALYAGPCFPRDNLNFAKYLRSNNIPDYIPDTSDKINNIQINRYISVYKKYKNLLNKKITIGICGISYKQDTPVTTSSPGEKIIEYFKNKNEIIIFDTTNPYINNKKLNFFTDIKKFYEKSDIIFVCYKNQYFKKLENFKTNKKKIIIDLWNFIKINKKNITLKNIGIS